jgi:hypothetical protein
MTAVVDCGKYIAVKGRFFVFKNFVLTFYVHTHIITYGN